MDNQSLNVIFGLVMIVAVIGILIILFLRERNVARLTQTLIELAQNPPALDKMEAFAGKYVPVTLVEQSLKGIDFLKTFTPQAVDAFLDAIKDVVTKITDNQPNITPPDEPAA